MEDLHKQLAQIIRTAPDDATCQNILLALDGYIATQLAGQNYQLRFPEVSFHLDGCLTCAHAYARLYELALAEAAQQLPAPAHIPAPNLDFLNRETAVSLPQLLQNALHRTANYLTLQLSAQLLPLLQPPPALALRAPTDEGRYAHCLLLLEATNTLPLSLAVYQDAHNPTNCLVEVTLELPDRHWPDLAGTAVSLHTPTHQAHTTTDAWGIAVFEGIKTAELPHLTIELHGLPNNIKRET